MAQTFDILPKVERNTFLFYIVDNMNTDGTIKRQGTGEQIIGPISAFCHTQTLYSLMHSCDVMYPCDVTMDHTTYYWGKWLSQNVAHACEMGYQTQ